MLWTETVHIKPAILFLNIDTLDSRLIRFSAAEALTQCKVSLVSIILILPKAYPLMVEELYGDGIVSYFLIVYPVNTFIIPLYCVVCASQSSHIYNNWLYIVNA